MINNDQRDEIKGFAGTAWRHRKAILASWDIYTAFLIGLLLALLAPSNRICQFFSGLLTAELGVASALVGVILAGLAIVTVFLDKDYIAVLAKIGHGLEADVFPFWFTASLAVTSIVINVVALVMEGFFENYAYRIFLGLSTWLFLWTLFASLNLVAFIAGHARNRSYQIMKQQEKS